MTAKPTMTTPQPRWARPSGWPSAVPDPSLTPPAPTRTVSTTGEISSALDNAVSGDVVKITPGRYGPVDLHRSGVTVLGGPGVVFDGGSYDADYAFRVHDASGVRLIGFTVRDAQKGLLIENTQRSALQDLTVTDTGDEGLAIRKSSSDNLLYHMTVHDTGKTEPGYGEGIYVGQWSGTWSSPGNPDRSDRNVISHCRVYATGAESVDVKEGTSGGILEYTAMDGARMSGQNYADSAVDAQGNDWVYRGNVAKNALLDGFKTHVIVTGWGTDNVFEANVISNSPGYGINLEKRLTNVVRCDNVISNLGKGLSNTQCAP